MDKEQVMVLLSLPQGDANTILQGQPACVGATVWAKDLLSSSCITFCLHPRCRHRFQPRLACPHL